MSNLACENKAVCPYAHAPEIESRLAQNVPEAKGCLCFWHALLAPKPQSNVFTNCKGLPKGLGRGVRLFNSSTTLNGPAKGHVLAIAARLCWENVIDFRGSRVLNIVGSDYTHHPTVMKLHHI